MEPHCVVNDISLQEAMEVFNKELKVCDVEKKLTIPTHCLWLFPGLCEKHYVDVKVKHRGQKPWVFRCSRRKAGPYAKPVVTGDWLKFVHHNKLKIGDRITLIYEVDRAHDVQYKIYVNRKITLLGEDVWVDLK